MRAWYPSPLTTAFIPSCFTRTGLVERCIIDRFQVPMNLLGHSFNLFTQRSIDKNYDPACVEAARSGLSQLLRTRVILSDPNWGEIYGVLQRAKPSFADIDLGRTALERFAELRDRLQALPEMHEPAIRQQLENRLGGSDLQIRIRVLEQDLSEFEPVTTEPGIMFIQFTPNGFCNGDRYLGVNLLEHLTGVIVSLWLS
ncbi:hypothetical protein MIND_00416200 [Mycena indigotica]|uniref:Uncharacterized protein n=1 Tax=Mycena indigotica TaxID=2126181 RepID=A0A8H6W585_9AGAR|nr:uncharacterized protein MIND_00416200 [Mycena indigotica]KAF7306254.1 hypothetical protein MIND_00416200 [Mycena indigotica]